jgi:4-amino-4-deoxychorismate lyase
MSGTTPVSVQVNGTDGCLLDVSDRGLNYGDGVFETIAINQFKPRLLDFHWQRLQQGCDRLSIPINIELFQQEIIQLLADKPVEQGILKLVVSRGSDSLGYQYPAGLQSTRIASLHKSVSRNPDYPEKGVSVRLCETKLARQTQLAGIKHLNRLEQVLARAEWRDPGIKEGLMRDTEGWIVDGTRSNLFIVENGKLVTPDLTYCGIAGVMRRAIMEIIAPDLHISCDSSEINDQRLANADEVFICNSVFGVWPVISLAEDCWKIGPVTQQIMQAVERLIYD